MNVSASDLYPVVQDLTEAEYGCCSSGVVFGSFSLQDLASPNAMPLPASPRNGLRNEHLSPRSVIHRENSLNHNPNAGVRERESTVGTTIREHSNSRFEDTYVLTRQVSFDLQGIRSRSSITVSLLPMKDT